MCRPPGSPRASGSRTAPHSAAGEAGRGIGEGEDLPEGQPPEEGVQETGVENVPAPVVSTASTRMGGEKISSRASHPNARGGKRHVDVLGA